MGHKFTSYSDYSKQKSFFNLSTEHKVYIGIGLATVVIIVGGIFLVSNSGPSTKPLMGQVVAVSGGHVPQGTPLQYSTNPPAGGQHYDTTAHAGIYDTSNLPADGNLVHSLEHGAVILWYNPKRLSTDQMNKLKTIFNQTSGKGIMAPRSSMDVPVGLSSWGQVLKLKNIDEKQVKGFFETNNNRGPESAPI